ncbi:hypothetical protein ES705_33259 [subsurface metagenome]
MKTLRRYSDKRVLEANKALVYTIGVLQGKFVVSRPAGRLHIALILRDQLRETGFWWQSWVLNCWIHQFQGGEFAHE